MRSTRACFVLSLSSFSVVIGFAQNPLAVARDKSPARQMPIMPGTSRDLPMQLNIPNPPVFQNPAQQLRPETPVPELLTEALRRAPMELQTFKQYALSTNPTLPQASALMRQAAGQARQAGLLPNPLVGYQAEQIRGGSYRGGEQGAFVQQTFVLGGKLRLRRDVFEQQRREDEIGIEEQRYRILSDVGQRFYATLAAQEIVDIRRRLMAVADDARETAHQLANVGQADEPDVLQSEVEAEQAKLDYTIAQRTFIQEFQKLAALVGKPELPLAPLAGNLENPPSIDANHIAEQIAQDSPSVKRAKQDIARAETELKSARRESIPDLQIHAGLQNNFEPINGFIDKPVGVQAFVTAGITLPLLNRNQGNVAAARADLERSQGEVTRVQLSLRQSAQPLLQAYLSAWAEVSRYKNEMVPRASRAYQLYLMKYQQMAAAYPQVIVSQRTLFQLEVGYINALEQVWMTAVALQNYTLSDGLSAPMPSGSTHPALNLPASSGGGAQ